MLSFSRPETPLEFVKPFSEQESEFQVGILGNMTHSADISLVSGDSRGQHGAAGDEGRGADVRSGEVLRGHPRQVRQVGRGRDGGGGQRRQ